MVVIVDIWVETNRTCAARNRLQLAHLGEVGERGVDGSQRNARHLCAGFDKESLGSRMRRIAVEQTKKQLALRCHLQPSGPECLCEFRRWLHGSDLTRIRCSSTTRANCAIPFVGNFLVVYAKKFPTNVHWDVRGGVQAGRVLSSN